jgi:hypothetical protein
MHGRPALRDVAKSPRSPAPVPMILGSKFVLRNTVRNSTFRGILYSVTCFQQGVIRPSGAIRGPVAASRVSNNIGHPHTQITAWHGWGEMCDRSVTSLASEGEPK